MTMRPPIGSAASEAVFGSAARRDSDGLSDRDYLLVDDDTTMLNRRSAELKGEGWSVAPYTFRKLETLAASGALFLQHLKDESQIVFDKGGRLAKVLSNFRAKQSYTDELEANSRLAALIRTRPDTPRGTLWAADVLYVTLRNYGVLSLAETRTYTFNYSVILDSLIDRRILYPGARSPLLRLRLLKALYRSGENFHSGRLNEALTAAVGYLPATSFPEESIAIPAVQVLADATPAGPSSSAYERLRGLEKCFVAASALQPALIDSKEAETLSAWIENPRAYASFASQMEAGQLGFLKSLVAKCSTKIVSG